ncbi:MAG: (2Fe-2S) ferredoxin domain-containing protein, partial [Clostridiales bacterium]|nr:(2Fe-2S) ferredoxin domain-containing protein [Clostridiales bacterium]
MKSLAELAEIKNTMKDKVSPAESSNGMRIVVGMATCGIAAGARPVLETLVSEISSKGLSATVSV